MGMGLTICTHIHIHTVGIQLELHFEVEIEVEGNESNIYYFPSNEEYDTASSRQSGIMLESANPSLNPNPTNPNPNPKWSNDQLQPVTTGLCED